MNRSDALEPEGTASPRGNRPRAGSEIDAGQLLELASAFARRERSAFEAVFRLFRGAIYSIGVLELGDAAEAEDLVQETFRRAWTAAGSLGDPNKLRGWLFSIARNLCSDVRDARRRRPLEIETLPEARLRSGTDAGPFAAAVRAERVRKVQQLLTTIPEQFRLILAMRLLDERSYQEISELLGIPLHSVKNAIARGGRILVDKIRNHPGMAPQDELA